jgi:hypothetical protein
VAIVVAEFVLLVLVFLQHVAVMMIVAAMPLIVFQMFAASVVQLTLIPMTAVLSILAAR